MKKIYFCRENGAETKKLYKFLNSLYKGIKIERKNCLGKCKTCKHCPIALVDNQLVKSATVDELYHKINKQHEKEWKKERKK